MKKYTDVIETEYFKRSKCKLSYVECDECGKKIQFNHLLEGYVRVHTWHNDWGNDSCESHEYMELCKDCAIKFTSNYILKMDGSEEIEISHSYVNPNETSIEGYVKIDKVVDK